MVILPQVMMQMKHQVLSTMKWADGQPTSLRYSEWRLAITIWVHYISWNQEIK